MKQLKISYLFFLLSVLLVSCEKDSVESDVLSEEPQQQFTVPEIPADIKSMMSTEDLALFEAGPGKEYLTKEITANARFKHGRWHPILMKLGYHVQFAPFVGESCESPIPCFGPGGPTGAPGCEDPANWLGSTGVTVADGYLFTKPVHSEYYPVFCYPDYVGYGEGFYEFQDGLLWLEAENGPFQFDAEGNSIFRRTGRYNPDKSAGIYSGVRGWEIALIYTAVENNPGTPGNDGIGYGDALIFGWAYW